MQPDTLARALIYRLTDNGRAPTQDRIRIEPSKGFHWSPTTPPRTKCASGSTYRLCSNSLSFSPVETPLTLAWGKTTPASAGPSMYWHRNITTRTLHPAFRLAGSHKEYDGDALPKEVTPEKATIAGLGCAAAGVCCCWGWRKLMKNLRKHCKNYNRFFKMLMKFSQIMYVPIILD